MSRVVWSTCLVLGVMAGLGSSAEAQRCASIRGGTLTTEAGDPIELGFDAWGYNYQAQLFLGEYCDAQRDAEWCQPYEGVKLVMKWNDAWLSNKDCDGDGLLDRHLGFESYQGSGAWVINVTHGEYEQDRRTCHWSNYTRIVAAPLEAELVDGVWYGADGDALGEQIWEEFFVAKDFLVDPCGGATPAS
jgi:hypothetical protein